MIDLRIAPFFCQADKPDQTQQTKPSHVEAFVPATIVAVG
jgi:hypothetical protein